MKVLVISCSLHPLSRSNVLAHQVVEDLKELEIAPHYLDLREIDLDFADAVTAHKTPEAEKVIGAIREADVVLLAMPVYNFDVNAAAKNLLEIGLSAWNNKLVGFLCAAGGRASYMSVMGLANSLMLDFRCLIIPRFVYATGDDFADDRTEEMRIGSDAVRERVRELARSAVELGMALRSVISS
ncbi:NAD(P)H-dependent oxidoreductase [Chloroflexi bacterium TSY]|nr:NAD(P)H-dependent oxidoreductase [Chloroflexi bacterium TSY]